MVQVISSIDTTIHEALFGIRVPRYSILPKMLTIEMRSRLPVIANPMQESHVSCPVQAVDGRMIVDLAHRRQCRVQLCKPIA